MKFLSNLAGYRLLCEDIFTEENINKEIEIFDLTTLRKPFEVFPILEIICVATVANIHYSPILRCKKFLHTPCSGDNKAVVIADISTYQNTVTYKTNFEIKTNQHKIIAYSEKAGQKYSVFILENKVCL